MMSVLITMEKTKDRVAQTAFFFKFLIVLGYHLHMGFL